MMSRRAAIVLILMTVAAGIERLGAAPDDHQFAPTAAPRPAFRTQSTQPRPQRSGSSPANIDAGAVLTQYCVTCHNERLKTGGLVIDPAQATNPSIDPERWEKVVRKLRAESMPPAGMPRPDGATYAAVAASVETALDRAAAIHPQLGRVAPVHRLTRTEYRNAVRDLFDLDALPREISVDYLLPPDNVSSGFDTIADLLFVSPSTMERYLDAARKISRVAVGDPTMPVLVNIHRIDEEQPQDERVDDLPFGTRGGLAVRSDFPVDATYTIKVELAGAPREAHQLEVTVDGSRVKLESIGGDSGNGSRRPPPAPIFEFPLPISAGAHTVGVTFIQHSEARDEATLRPRMRSRGTLAAIASVTISGPYSVSAPGDSPSRRRIFVCHPRAAEDEGPCARKILGVLARRAYRRPVTQQDIDDLLPFFESGRTEAGFDSGIERALQRMLVSSHFLFRVEHASADTRRQQTYRVRDLDLASQLSFFLWSSIPDETLLALAEAGKLSDPRILDQQVRRMLADRRSAALVTNFAAQWLYLRDIDAKHPDEVLFPDFDETLRSALHRETELFIDSVFRENRSVLELLTANYTFLNERLARHYGIPNVKGSYFRRVTLPADSVRGGLLGHGSVLTITSYANRTSPVLRGKWVLENLLSAAPPPPPPDVPALKTEAEPGKPLTMREAMTRHRAAPACAGCHARMDPIGFAMENFDAIGRWRDSDGGSPIDTTGVFPDGSRFQGMAGLKQALVRHPEEFVDTIAERLLMYALGRNLQYYDAPAVRAIVRAAAPSHFTFSALVSGVVTSRPFLERQRQTE
jgi:mono/diheme cytochrome c family protein